MYHHKSYILFVQLVLLGDVKPGVRVATSHDSFNFFLTQSQRLNSTNTSDACKHSCGKIDLYSPQELLRILLRLFSIKP